MTEQLRCGISRELSDDIVFLGDPTDPTTPDRSIGFDRQQLFNYLDSEIYQAWADCVLL